MEAPHWAFEKRALSLPDRGGPDTIRRVWESLEIQGSFCACRLELQLLGQLQK